MEILTICVVAIALICAKIGAHPEREAAIVIMTWAFLDQLYHFWFGFPTYRSVDFGHMVLDVVALLAFVRLGLKANRVWPILVCGAQLIAVIGHLAVWGSPTGVRRAYWVMTEIPILAVMAFLMFGSVAHVRRVNRVGRYRSWSF